MVGCLARFHLAWPDRLRGLNNRHANVGLAKKCAAKNEGQGVCLGMPQSLKRDSVRTKVRPLDSTEVGVAQQPLGVNTEGVQAISK